MPATLHGPREFRHRIPHLQEISLRDPCTQEIPIGDLLKERIGFLNTTTFKHKGLGGSQVLPPDGLPLDRAQLAVGRQAEPAEREA